MLPRPSQLPTTGVAAADSDSSVHAAPITSMTATDSGNESHDGEVPVQAMLALLPKIVIELVTGLVPALVDLAKLLVEMLPALAPLVPLLL